MGSDRSTPVPDPFTIGARPSLPILLYLVPNKIENGERQFSKQMAGVRQNLADTIRKDLICGTD